ncbi:MAG: MFS transporter [Planctomycetota bacterium]
MWKVKLTLLFAASLTVLSNAVIAPALPSIARAYPGASGVAIKLLVTLPALAIALLAPVSGVMADTLGRKRLLLGSVAVFVVAGGAGLVLDGVPALLVSRFALGLGVAGVMTASTTLVGDYFRGPQREAFMGLQSACMAFGGLIFVSAGGALAGLGWRYPFAVYLAALPLLFVAAVVLREPDRDTADSKASATEDEAKTSPATVALIFALGLVGMAMFYLVPVQVPFLVVDDFGGRELTGGLAIGACTLASGLIGLRYRVLAARLGPWGVAAATYALIALGYAAVWRSPSLPWLLAALAFAGLGTGLILPNVNVWLLAVAPERLRGRLVGGLTAAIFLGQFLSPVFTQPVIDRTDRITSFGIVAAVALLIAAALAGPAWRHRPTRN